MNRFVQVISFFLMLNLSSLFLFSGCSDAVTKKEPQKVSFYELCFNFPKLPENTTIKDIETTSLFYEEYLNHKNITVLKRRLNTDSVCYFLDSIPDFSLPLEEMSSNISQYILTAYFNPANSSVYGILPGKKEAVVIEDNIPFLRKLPIYVEKGEGLVFTGVNKKLLYVARYLQALEIEHEFGFNENGKFIVNIKPDYSDRWQMIPFLFDSLNLEEFVSPLPGDFAVLNDCRNEKVTLEIKMPSWKLSQVPVARDVGIINEDALVFSVSVMSLPFDEELLLKFFYTLANSYLLPPSSGLYYSPNFKGSGVRPTVLLFSSELAIFGEYALLPETIYMWAFSVNSQLKSYPDSFYANLLSLKISKKLYTGNPSFLGGAELLNMTTQVPFEKIREMLFHVGNVTVFGSLSSQLYLYNEDIISEFSAVIDKSKSTGVKVFYGSVENNKYSVVSFVVRAGNAESITNKIKNELINEGYIPFQILFEQVSINDSWGSVSIIAEREDEKKILDIYEKRFKLLNNTLSIGVYRVAKEE